MLKKIKIILLSPEVIIKTKQEWVKNSHINKSQYQIKYNESIKNNNLFWKKEGKSANCIDRHLKDKKDKTAIIWVGDDPKDFQKISYKQLHQKVSKAANGLKKLRYSKR